MGPGPRCALWRRARTDGKRYLEDERQQVVLADLLACCRQRCGAGLRTASASGHACARLFAQTTRLVGPPKIHESVKATLCHASTPSLLEASSRVSVGT
jgi:hypothetical protein